MTVTLAAESSRFSGSRDAGMTIWSVGIGRMGMIILLLTNLPSQRDRRLTGSRAHAPRLVPAEETDDGPRQVPDFAEQFGFTVAGTAPDSHRLPFEPPPPDLRPWAAP